jgi:crotonobetainyl-CoA:carnitine CoA-transferase CaiB-like acyl-CoA transferase
MMSAVSNDVSPQSTSGFFRPLTGYRILCAGKRGRATLHAGRMLADMGAEVLCVEQSAPDDLAKIMLARAPSIHPITAPDALSKADDVFAIVHEGDLDTLFDQSPALASACRVRLNWVDDADDGGCDEAAQAISGAACAIGERSRAPLWFPHRIGEYIQGVNAAGMVLLFALDGRQGIRGEIALADLWAYAAGTMRMLCEPKGIPYFRDGRRSPGNGGVYPQRLFKAKDGFITLLCRSSKEWAAILSAFGNPEWGENPRFRDILSMAREYPDETDVLVEGETQRFTKAELFKLAIEKGFPLAAVRSPLEALQDEYLERQGFWTESAAKRLPGSLWRPETFLTTPTSTLDPVAQRSGNAPDLTGYRVLDLSWVWAGPMVGSMLADLGAEVIKVEHEKRLDNMRLRGKLPSSIPDAQKDIDPRETDPLFHNVNRGKKSILLDMKAEEGRKVFLDLVAKSDIILESFRPHVLESWGLGFDVLKKANPKIVLLSLRGLELDESFGPSGLRSYAPITSSLCGLESQIGYDDSDEPTGGMAIGISDPVAGWHGFTLLLGALLAAARSGNGGWIRLSQLETLSSVLPEMYLTAQDSALSTCQLKSRAVCCQDGDAIVQVADETWEKLVANGTIDTAGPDPKAAATAELAVAVAKLGGHAWPVSTIDIHDRWNDVFGRDLMVPVDHALCGREELLTHGWAINGETIRPRNSAPIIGVDTDTEMASLAGLDKDGIAELRARRVLS